MNNISLRIYHVFIYSSAEFDQVFKDQLTPAISTCIHQQSAFRKPPSWIGEKQIFGKRTDLRCCAVMVARQ